MEIPLCLSLISSERYNFISEDDYQAGRSEVAYGKKAEKGFKERHRQALKEMFHSKTDTIPEESKLKHNDDYRGKIVHEKKISG